MRNDQLWELVARPDMGVPAHISLYHHYLCINTSPCAAILPKVYMVRPEPPWARTQFRRFFKTNFIQHEEIFVLESWRVWANNWQWSWKHNLFSRINGEVWYIQISFLSTFSLETLNQNLTTVYFHCHLYKIVKFVKQLCLARYVWVDIQVDI